MLVQDFVSIRQREHVARAAILDEGGGWMVLAASRALAEGAAADQRDGPLARTVSAHGALALSLGLVRSRRDATLIGMAWTVGTEGSQPPLLEGDLELSTLDEHTSHMGLAAQLRLDEAEASSPTRAHARRCAQVVVRSFLDEVGREIERRTAG